MAQINLTPKRISAMPPMEDPSVLEPTEAAKNWGMAVDSLCRSNAADRPDGSGLHEGEDQGTLYVPMNRIALRDSNGKIPASMLPGHIDDMIFGTMDFTTDLTRAAFTEPHPPGATTDRVYVSPESRRDPATEFEPPQNVIYCDTTTNIQYRFTGETSTSTNLNHYGFAVIPNSLAIVQGYGINVDATSGTSVLINAKKADFFTSYGASNAVTVTSTASNIPIASGSAERSIIDVVTASDRLTKLTGLIGGARYALSLQLECTPDTLSANIIDVSVTCGTVATIKQQMDMSGPNNTASQTPSVTSLGYFCEFKNPDNNTELTVTIAADEQISVKTTRFTIFELL